LQQNLSKENILKILSSEYNLNQKEINQVKATLNNKEWNEKHTTLSTLGAIIVAAVVTIATAGAGTGEAVAGVSAAQSAVTAANLAVVTSGTMVSEAAAVSAASALTTATITASVTNAVVAGIGTQLATSAITGESFKLDAKSLIQGAVTAGVLSYVNSSIIKPDTTDALRNNMNITKYVKNATIRGTEQGIVSKLTGGSFQNGFKAGATLSILNDTSLQMRKYVKENFDYSGKDGGKVKPKYQSAGINGDGVKLGGSHPVLNPKSNKGYTDIIAPLGGAQLDERKIFKHSYSKGGLIDSSIEHFAGPHDFLSSWNYENIDGKTYLKNNNFMINASSGLLLFPAAPLAASTAIENNIGLIDNIIINKHYNIDKAKDKKVKTFMDIYNQQQKEMKNENQ
jgi:filamentous hemagglutinin